MLDNLKNLKGHNQMMNADSVAEKVIGILCDIKGKMTAQISKEKGIYNQI